MHRADFSGYLNHKWDVQRRMSARWTETDGGHYRSKPDVSNIRSFRRMKFVSMSGKFRSGKLASEASQLIMVGYSVEACSVCIPETGQMSISMAFRMIEDTPGRNVEATMDMEQPVYTLK